MKNKQYLRYVASGKCGVVASSWSNMVLVEQEAKRGPLCAVGACEDVIIWNLKQAEKHATLLSEDKHQVTVLATSPVDRTLAVGFRNGSLRVFDLKSQEICVTFNGHRSPVSCLNFDPLGARLVSGGMDTDVVVWDVHEEGGLFRLKGHSAPVTQARFIRNRDVLVTSSKDTLIKFWDLETQHCFKTLVEHSTEIYDFILAKEDSLLITGSGVSNLNVWNLVYKARNYDSISQTDIHTDNQEDSQEDNIDFIDVRKLGSIERRGKGHVISMCQDKPLVYFGCHGSDNKVELWRLYTDQESDKHKKKSDKKKKLKAVKRQADGEMVVDEDEGIMEEKGVDDYVKKVGYFKLKSPLRTFQFVSVEGHTAKLVVMFRNNSLRAYTLDLSPPVNRDSPAIKADKEEDSLPKDHLKEPLHVSFAHNNFSFMSLSKESLKIWNSATLKSTHMLCSRGVCCLFAFDDRKAVVGIEDGRLEIYDLETNDLIDSVEGHQSSVTAMCLSNDKLGLLSGSRDKTVVFWDLEFDVDASGENRKFTLKARKRVVVADEVLCLSYSADQKYFAVGCLDRKGYIFFADSMKSYKVLYSHNLPITCLDISTDATTLATGSGDKDVKIWSMDFGECKRIIKVAHDDKITGLKFLPKTHMFFTCSRDGLLKQWDADHFTLIISLQGHQSAIHSVAVSRDGRMVLTCSEDMSIRTWIKTDEILALDEEKETVREKEEDDQVREDIMVIGAINNESGFAGKKTKETLSAVERLMEALDLHKEETDKEEEHQKNCKELNKELPPPPRHLMLQAFNAKTANHYLLQVISKIRSSEIEGCLLCLPFPYKSRLLPFLCSYHGEGDMFITRSLLFLLRQDAGQVLSSGMYRRELEDCQRLGNHKNIQYQDMSGYVMAANVMMRKKKKMAEETAFESNFNKKIKLKI